VENEGLVGDEPDASIGHVRIESLPASAQDLREGHLYSERGAIGSVGSHRLDDVSHGQDAGLEQDLVPPRPAG